MSHEHNHERYDHDGMEHHGHAADEHGDHGDHGGYDAHAGHRKMVQNLIWATGYNVVALPLAAGVLAPVGIVLAPAFAAVVMSTSTVIVALNAQLLRRPDLEYV